MPALSHNPTADSSYSAAPVYLTEKTKHMVEHMEFLLRKCNIFKSAHIIMLSRFRDVPFSCIYFPLFVYLRLEVSIKKSVPPGRKVCFAKK